jgi:hypothetical protein
MQQDSVVYKIDPSEASFMQRIIRPGLVGQANFDFAYVGGKLALEPTRVTFMVPASETHSGQQMSQMMGQGGLDSQLANMPGMGQMMQQMVQNMNVPIMLNFGEIEGDGAMEGISGNKIRQGVVSNSVRELKPGVVEQQIVTRQSERLPNGSVKQSYGETVMRFTKLSPNQLYAVAASVQYGVDKRFQRKIVLYGTVTRGQVMQTNPYEGMQQMMVPGGGGQMPQIPGMSGGSNSANPADLLKQLQQLLGPH